MYDSYVSLKQNIYDNGPSMNCSILAVCLAMYYSIKMQSYLLYMLLDIYEREFMIFTIEQDSNASLSKRGINMSSDLLPNLCNYNCIIHVFATRNKCCLN
jgi:hypothetical protein